MNPSTYYGSSKVLQMGPYDPASLMGAVTVFSSGDCSDKAARFYWNPLDRNGGTYNLSDLEKGGMWNNYAGSIKVPKGYSVTLFDGKGLDDPIERIEGSYLDEQSQSMPC